MKKESSKKKIMILIIMMAVLLVGALTYVGVDMYSKARQDRDMQMATYGYEQAVVDLMNEVSASNCQPVPVNYLNATVNLIDITCLQQA